MNKIAFIVLIEFTASPSAMLSSFQEQIPPFSSSQYCLRLNFARRCCLVLTLQTWQSSCRRHVPWCKSRECG
ncbi:hypothetical protein BJ741DRAFT_616150, partial [Chytriomyces cf. hyalinus JEL632]